MTKIKIIDGGMGEELARNGAPFRQPEWSALALIEAPEFVTKAHNAYLDAGAEIITTNSYAIVPFHIGEERFWRDGEALASLAGKLARDAVDNAQHPAKVAGSLPPPMGSYRPDLFEPIAGKQILLKIIAGLTKSVDFWLAETQGSIVEIETVREALGNDTRPLWVSFTLEEELTEGRARLRSKEAVADAVQAAVRLGASSVLFNCSRPEVMGPAVAEARKVTGIDIGVYANAFEPGETEILANDSNGPLREDLDAQKYLSFSQRWVELGANIVGGCCGIGPRHIACLSANFHQAKPPRGPLSCQG